MIKVLKYRLFRIPWISNTLTQKKIKKHPVWLKSYQDRQINAPDAVVCSALSQTRGQLPLSGSTLMTIWKVSQGVQKSNLIINKSLQENQRK